MARVGKVSRMVRMAASALLVALALLLAPQVPQALAEQADPFQASVAATAADGTYKVEVALAGGTGRATVESPATLVVRDARMALTLVWSSPNYDYMVVGGERYLPEIADGHSRFQIPVLALDEPFEVVADTTAMPEPHEISYEITVDSSTMVPETSAMQDAGMPAGLVAAVACGVLAAMALARRLSRA